MSDILSERAAIRWRGERAANERVRGVSRSRLLIKDPIFPAYMKELKVLDGSELLSAQFPPRRSMLSPWLPEKGLTMLYAPRGVGKTWIALRHRPRRCWRKRVSSLARAESPSSSLHRRGNACSRAPRALHSRHRSIWHGCAWRELSAPGSGYTGGRAARPRGPGGAAILRSAYLGSGSYDRR